MVLAELFEKDTNKFLCIIMCNSKEEMEKITEIMAFTIDVEMDGIDYSESIIYQ